MTTPTTPTPPAGAPIPTAHAATAGATADDAPTGRFAPLAGARTVLLTTFRRDGTPVGTPVHLVLDGDEVRVRTFEPSGKLTRIRRDPRVEVAPCTVRGRPTGEAVPARARILAGAEADDAARALARRYPLIHGRLVPWFHRRKGLRTVHLSLTPR